MILISHRGNLNGPKPELENNPDYILKAFHIGFEVEIDVWFIKNSFYLGHDIPEYPVSELFLTTPKLWCHAKNIEALNQMLKNEQIHCFWHQNDDVTLTSRNVIWTYPDKELTTNSICVLPELHKSPIVKCLGICSDFINKYV